VSFGARVRALFSKLFRAVRHTAVVDSFAAVSGSFCASAAAGGGGRNLKDRVGNFIIEAMNRDRGLANSGAGEKNLCGRA
jgi:hypothetical protein